jgi:hypothetical protein
MPKVYVDNRNKTHERFCTAFDGQQVQVNPGAKRAPIDEKFTWKMHPDISLSTGSIHTFKTADEEAAEKTKKESQNSKDVENKEAANTSEGSPKTNS